MRALTAIEHLRAAAGILKSPTFTIKGNTLDGGKMTVNEPETELAAQLMEIAARLDAKYVSTIIGLASLRGTGE